MDGAAARTRAGSAEFGRAGDRLDEVPFGIKEVFYSRTDRRGVIGAGNTVFQRISGFTWEELVGAPHRIVRHPDMPRGLYCLMWDRLKAGQMVGAYVKNRAKDGRHYWVFAVMTPVADGYLSLRIKPTGPLLATARDLYATLLREEAAGAPPEVSAQALVSAVQSDDGAGYAGFMARALMSELALRQQARGLPPVASLAGIAETGDRLREVLGAQTQLLAEFADIRSFPTNLRIAARRLETSGAPVASLAENYRLMSDEITRRIETLTERSDRKGQSVPPLAAVLAEAQFQAGLAHLQREAVSVLETENLDGAPFTIGQEIAAMRSLETIHGRQAADGVSEVAQEVRRMMTVCGETRKLILGLNSIRVLCRVEAGRLHHEGEALQSIIARLDSFHAQVEERLDSVERLSSQALNALTRSVKDAA
jgi:aerotaxis receptor